MDANVYPLCQSITNAALSLTINQTNQPTNQPEAWLGGARFVGKLF